MPKFIRSFKRETPLNHTTTISSISSRGTAVQSPYFSDNAQLEQNIHRLNPKDIQYLEFAEINSMQIKLNAYPHRDYSIISSQVTSLTANAKPHQKLDLVDDLEIKLGLDEQMVTHKARKEKEGSYFSSLDRS